MSEEIFLPCECHSEVMLFSYSKEDESFDISIYEHMNTRYSLWFKIKMCWRILRYGTPYGDQLIVTKDNMKKLLRYLERKCL